LTVVLAISAMSFFFLACPSPRRYHMLSQLFRFICRTDSISKKTSRVKCRH
jgi:hypothetical protein